MKRLATILLFIVMTLFLAQCAPKVRKDTTVTTVPVAQKPNPDLAAGKMIFETSCGRCHKLFLPESRTVAAWERILPSMYHKARLDEKQSALVQAYIMPNAKKG